MTTWPYPRWFAHRGGGTHAPENTLAALRTGLAMGFTAVEFDVKLSRDGVALLMHDARLERTTSGQGDVRDHDFADLAKLDAGAWHSPEFTGEPVPSFEQAATFIVANGMQANVEIKPCPGRERETGTVVARQTGQLWSGQTALPLVSSFSVEALRVARAAAPDLPLGLLVQGFSPSHWAVLDELGCVSLHCRHTALDLSTLNALHARALRVLCYTVNDPARARVLLDWGVDGLFTDALKVMHDQFLQPA